MMNRNLVNILSSDDDGWKITAGTINVNNVKAAH